MKKFVPNTKEFTKDMLPHNRIEQFFDVVKLNWKTILGIGLLLLLFSLPVVGVLIFGDYRATSILQNKELTQEDISSLIIANKLITAGILIVGLVIFAICIAGILRIIRSIVFSEGVFFWHDFAKGIKQNGLTFVILFFILGVLNFLVTLVINATVDIPSFLLYLPLFILALLIYPIAVVETFYLNLYCSSFFKAVKNCAYLYFRHLPFYLLFIALLSINIPIVLLISSILIRYFVMLCITTVFVPFALVMLFIYSNKVFDLHINKDHYPELYSKGLYIIK